MDLIYLGLFVLNIIWFFDIDVTKKMLRGLSFATSVVAFVGLYNSW